MEKNLVNSNKKVSRWETYDREKMHVLNLRSTNHLLLLCKLQLVQSHFHHDLVTNDFYWISLNSDHLITLILLQQCDKTVTIRRKAIPAKDISRVELMYDGIESETID